MSELLNTKIKNNVNGSNNHKNGSKDLRDISYKLPDLLKYGMTVVTNVWNYSAHDWVSSVQAADVDSDGDIEILLGSRDGFVRALTRWGSLKWETRLGAGKWVSSVVAVPQPELASSQPDNTNLAPYVIAGSRDGRVYALDQQGRALPEWEEYDTGGVVRQVYIHPEWPDRVVIGSESCCLSVLDCRTGKPLYKPFLAQGGITSVFAYDIDADGEPEILAGSADGHVYLLNFATGELEGTIPVGNKVYALYAAHLEPEGRGPASILVSTNGKDLSAWTVEAREGRLVPKRTWIVALKDRLFSNRLHAITVADINNDNYAEILVGSEDKHFYVLDYRGKPLWKCALDSCVNSITALDINFDGIVEVVIGLEDNQVRVFHVDLVAGLYDEIHKACKKLGRVRHREANALSFAEYMLLKDLVVDEEPQGSFMELEHAMLAMGIREYGQALATLLRLNRQRVQHYWRSPMAGIGHIRAFCLGDVAGDPKNEILLGNDEGMITAIDIERARILWNSSSLKQRIWMLDRGTTDLHEYDTLLATLADNRVRVLGHRGQILEEKELMLEGERIWCVSIHKQSGSEQQSNEADVIREILLGSEHKIYVYDAKLEEQRLVIHAPQGVKIIRTCDLTEPASGEIVCAGMDNQIYVYSRKGMEQWRYAMQDRIRAICTKDIDGDGQLEILVGSEDRYVYVLDCKGHLKWRYYMPHRVLSIDALDIDQDGHCEILVGVADSYMYVLNAEGDELWKFKANDRVRVVSAGDMNDDGKVEIAVASDDQLVLLQVIKPDDLQQRIKECFGLKLRLEATNTDAPHSAKTVRRLARSDDEYVRAFAIQALAGSDADHIPEDFELIQDALKDKSPEVRRNMVPTVIALARVAIRKDDQYSIRQSRRFLSQLSSDPSHEVRNELIGHLHKLTEADYSLCFEYLERFTNSVDIWVRRTVVRQLDKLVEAHPTQSFRLLMEMAQDPNEWIRQECGRSLAHYLDAHKDRAIVDLHELLMRGVDILVMQQMSYSAQVPLIKSALSVLARIMTSSTEQEMLTLLDETVVVLEGIKDAGIRLGDEVHRVYREFNQLLRMRTVNDIVQYVRITTSQLGNDIPRFSNVIRIFDSLFDVVHILKAYQRRQALGDRASSLLDAHESLEHIRTDLEAERVRRSHQKAYSVQLPEDMILDLVQQRWSDIVKRELQQLRGRAVLSFELREQTASVGEPLTVVLVISNTGHCPADNVCITLETSDQFTLDKSNQHELAEISTLRPSRVEFVICPQTNDPLQLEFTIGYDDAERRGKRETFRDRLSLREFRGPSFRDIPNRYTTGTPVRTAEMFYGHEDYLEFLQEKLTNTSNNTVVILTGQRRAGKTSLIYQLTNERQLLSPHAAVLIDLQTLALKSDVNQLLVGIATTIYDELKTHGITVLHPREFSFDGDATSIFDQFIKQVLQALAGRRLILLFDEFEMLEQKIKEEQLDANFLQYLRGLMQHRAGINFLLAGAPRIRNLTEGYWSTFFNLAVHCPISKLKPEDAQRLIEEPVAGYLEYDHSAIEKIRQLTGDQPYLIHSMCDALIRDRNRKRKNYVNTNDVNLAVEQILKRGENQFAWINERAHFPEARFILSVLAQVLGEEERVFSLGDIKEVYTQHGLQFEQERVLQYMRHLVQEEFVEEYENATQFRIPVGLVRGWLQKAWPPERVVRVEKLAKA